MEKIRVLLVDDHALVRESLSHLIRGESDLEVVSTLPKADEVLGQVRMHHPRVIVLDIDMPGRSSFDVAREVLSQHPEVRVLFLSAFHHDRYIEDALAAGASGFLTKDEPPSVLIHAIRSLAGGGAYFSERVRGRLRIEPNGTAHLATARPTRVSSLTPRELEVLRHLARGLSKKEIAAALKRSYSTIDRHTENLMAKLDIHDRVELARFAIREGLAEP